MNKEEIKKSIKVVFNEECKECYFPKRKCASCVREGKKKIKKYIKYLEQKESILDKVTDKLKEKIELIEDVIDLCKTDGKIAKYKIEQLEEEKGDLQEILNIIEGGNNGK